MIRVLMFWFVLSAAAFGRLWTSADGTKAFEGDFIKFENGGVYVRLESGKQIQFLLSVLSQADQDFVLRAQQILDETNAEVRQATPQVQPPPTQPTPSSQASQPEAQGVLPTKQSATVRQPTFQAISPFLTRFDGRAFQPVRLRQIPQYYVIYYGASWCPACNSSLADFKTVYNSVIRPDPNFEVIHVSADLNVRDAEQWARANGLIWPTVQNVDREASGLLPYSSGLTPSYTLIDGQGRVLATTGAACVKEMRRLQTGGA